jgi:hypothetical protein
MTRPATPIRLLGLMGALMLCGMQTAQAHDYPTADRVTWVQACMQEHPGHYFEMVNKCSCAIDRIARDVGYDTFTTMNTATNANSIGGERGGSLRASDTVQQQVRQYRALQKQAKAACFIQAAPPASAASAP